MIMQNLIMQNVCCFSQLVLSKEINWARNKENQIWYIKL